MLRTSLSQLLTVSVAILAACSAEDAGPGGASGSGGTQSASGGSSSGGTGATAGGTGGVGGSGASSGAGGIATGGSGGTDAVGGTGGSAGASGGTGGAGGAAGAGTGGSAGGGSTPCVPGQFNGLSSGSGGDYRCAITAGGAVTCFTSSNQWSLQWEDASTVMGARSVATIGVGSGEGCLVAEAGSVHCWQQAGAVSPTPIIDAGAVQVCGGYNHACAVVRENDRGSVWCWGSDDEGQLGGDGTTTTAGLAPIDGDVLAVSCGYRSSCALTANGSVFCWGDNQNGEVGNGSSGAFIESPAPTSALGSKAISISVGQDQTCALLEGGTAKCWGTNYDGRLGFGPPPYTVTAPDQAVGSDLVAVSSAKFSVCLLNAAGTVTCHGAAESDALDGLTGVVALSGGHTHHCAVKTNGSITCSGLMSPTGVSVEARDCGL